MGSNLVSLVRNLQQRKGRKRQGLAVAEGIRLVEEALAAGVALRGVLVSPALAGTPRGTALLAELAAHAVPLEEVPDREFGRLAGTETPQGVLAVVDPPTWTLDALAPAPGAPVLVLDAVQDPGNVGTLLRSAFALGAAGAVLLKGTADPNNPKVVRAAMGATFRLPSASADDGQFAAWARARDVTVWVSVAQGTPLAQVAPPERLALVVGNEGAGIRDAIRDLAAERIAIPLARGAESLNVAVAAGILLHEVTRAA